MACPACSHIRHRHGPMSTTRSSRRVEESGVNGGVSLRKPFCYSLGYEQIRSWSVAFWPVAIGTASGERLGSKCQVTASGTTSLVATKIPCAAVGVLCRVHLSDRRPLPPERLLSQSGATPAPASPSATYHVRGMPAAADCVQQKQLLLVFSARSVSAAIVVRKDRAKTLCMGAQR